MRKEKVLSDAGTRDTKHTHDTRVATRTGRKLKVTMHLPTLTDVLPSSSEALLPPPALLCTLMRLLLLGAGRTMALSGRCGSVPGEAGGEAILPGRKWAVSR